jgi:hypothetical protein
VAVIQHNAGKYGHAEILIDPEGAKAGIAITLADQPQVVYEQADTQQ